MLEKAKLNRSYNFRIEDSLPCKWLYRNKPPKYFDDIRDNHGNIMEVYVKDKNGDPASVINGRLHGLFFCANIDFCTGLPMTKTNFGSRRLLVPVDEMFMSAPNLYFADFYCNFAHPHPHYATLVMARIGSVADAFCRNRLPALSTMENPFLFRGEDGSWRVSTRIMVEVLYTEDINLNVFRNITHGTPERINIRHNGLPKLPGCKECNLYDAPIPNAVII